MGEKMIIANSVFAQDGVAIYGAPAGEVIGTCPLTDEEIISGTVMSFIKEVKVNQYGLPKLQSLKKEIFKEVLIKIEANLLLANQDKDSFINTLNENLAEIKTEYSLRKKELKENSELMDLFPRGEKKGPDYENLKGQENFIRLAMDKLVDKFNKIKDFKTKLISTTDTEITTSLKSVEKILSNIDHWQNGYVPFAGYNAGKKVEKLLTWQYDHEFVSQTRKGLLTQGMVEEEEADE